jgi:formate hydrogenlyase subunit 6/NADH:ubiquinone oxidoreductase subunit I
MSTFSEFLKSSREILSNLRHKPNTILYPSNHVPIPINYRGAPDISDPSKCFLCMKCVRICPTQAISITDFDKVISIFEINLGRCCYCQECEDNCTFSAIKLTPEINTSSLDKKLLIKSIKVKKRIKNKAD